MKQDKNNLSLKFFFKLNKRLNVWTFRRLSTVLCRVSFMQLILSWGNPYYVREVDDKRDKARNFFHKMHLHPQHPMMAFCSPPIRFGKVAILPGCAQPDPCLSSFFQAPAMLFEGRATERESDWLANAITVAPCLASSMPISLSLHPPLFTAFHLLLPSKYYRVPSSRRVLADHRRLHFFFNFFYFV